MRLLNLPFSAALLFLFGSIAAAEDHPDLRRLSTEEQVQQLHERARRAARNGERKHAMKQFEKDLGELSPDQLRKLYDAFQKKTGGKNQGIEDPDERPDPDRPGRSVPSTEPLPPEAPSLPDVRQRPARTENWNGKSQL